MSALEALDLAGKGLNAFSVLFKLISNRYENDIKNLVSYHSHQTPIKDMKKIKLIKIISKNFDITLIGNFFDQTLKFDQFIDILFHQTRVKILDRIYTSNPINNISNVWSGQ
jgi:hypothetical protein